MVDQPPIKKPSKAQTPAPEVREFLSQLKAAMAIKDDAGRSWASAKWGVYAFFDYDGEPIYVGQTNEKLSSRVRRHLSNQRTDAVAMRVLDIFEVAEMELYPLWEYQKKPTKNGDPAGFKQAKEHLDQLEYAVYLDAIDNSRFKAILNEKVPPVSATVELPPSKRISLISEETRAANSHGDIRVARRAETISRLASVVYERGAVSEGLRRVLVIQAVRLAYLSAVRLAEVEGRPEPDPTTFEVANLIGIDLFEAAADTDEGDDQGDDEGDHTGDDWHGDLGH